MRLIVKKKNGMLECWNVGILGKIKLFNYQLPFFHLSIIPIKLNNSSGKTYYNFNHKK